MTKPPAKETSTAAAAVATPADTPQTLVDLSNALSDFSDRLDDYIKSSGDPFTPVMQQLRNMDTHIAADADLIGRLAVEALANDVSAAISDLNDQVKAAKTTLDNIANVKTALSIVAAVLSTAAAISSGNPLASAQSVLSLAQVIASAVKSADSAKS